MTSRAEGAANLQREVEKLSLLYEISHKLEESLDLREVAEPVLDLLAKHTGMMHGMLTLFNRQTGEISAQAGHGLSASQRERGRYRPGEGVVGKVVETGRAVVVPKISEEPLFLDRTGTRKNLRKEDISFLCVPIRVGREVVGTLSADRLFADDVALKEDVRILTIVASMIAQAVKLRQTVEEERQRLLAENERLQNALRERFHPANIIGNSGAMQSVYDQIHQVARADTTVLLRGESGTGKELVAQAVHHQSPRSTKPCVRVNCAALSETLLESELFGHEKGAFTGALARKIGRFELAASGTLFLDEIGDISPATQVRLLRVLQEKEFERVGGIETVKSNVRIITATNRNLEELVATGSFREDLYYRLSVFPIHLPPLRERKTDIPLLVDHFIAKHAAAMAKDVRRVSTAAIDMLMAYHWPGNVRELENVIERAVLVTTDRVIHGHHLPPTLQTAEQSGTIHRGSLEETLDRVEKEIIQDALKNARGNCSKAAQALGITERIFGLRLKKFDIEFKRFRDSHRGQ